jgi:hypothetical protein
LIEVVLEVFFSHLLFPLALQDDADWEKLGVKAVSGASMCFVFYYNTCIFSFE